MWLKVALNTFGKVADTHYILIFFEEITFELKLSFQIDRIHSVFLTTWVYRHSCIWVGVRVMVFNATFNHISAISWRSALLVEETAVPGENTMYSIYLK
jgi:hypothetical protein